MAALQAEINNLHAQIQGIPMTPKKVRAERLSELHEQRRKKHAEYTEKREDLERLQLLPDAKD